MGNPHDSLFKQVLGQPERAATFLRRFLPGSVATSLALERTRVVPGSFVDEELANRHTDLLLEVPRRRGPGPAEPLLIYVLLEHQSSVDRWMSRRLMRYVDRIWSRWEARRPTMRVLPVVVPMVVYHGERRWSGPTQLHALVDWGLEPSLEASLGEYVPGMSFLLMDLGRTADADLGHDGVALTLKVMKYIRAKDFERRFEQLALDLRAVVGEPSGLQLLILLVHYMFTVREALDRDRLSRFISTTTGPTIGAQVMTVADQLREEGRREGREEGRKEGREEGREEGRRAEIQLLTRLLTRRFGTVPQRVLDLLEGSSAAKRLAWGERVVDAATLHEAFGSDWEH